MNYADAASLFGQSAQNKTPKMDVKPYENFPVVSLITRRRADLAIKYRFFKNLIGGTDERANVVYDWHIQQRCKHRFERGLAMDGWKRTVADYRQAAVYLLENMQKNGFDSETPVPIDPYGELMNGSHRVACAAALGIKEIPIVRVQQPAWAPPWDIEWFVDHGLEYEDMTLMHKHIGEMACG